MNALTPYSNDAPDSWDCAASELGPTRGIEARFDGVFVLGREKTPIKEGKRYGVEGRAEGWLKLQKDVPPEWLLRENNKLKPAQPFVDPKDYVTDLAGKKVIPWKYNYWVYLVDLENGETITFRTDTYGGTLAVRELTEQIASMRNRSKASAMPIVELQSRQMKTDFGLKPRPHLQIVGWRFPDGDNIGHDESAPMIEQPNDPLPQF
jgi:hypothetical protein